jgi:cholinesterase
VNNEGSPNSKPDSIQARIQNCPSHADAELRRKAGVKAWRYLYSGEFPNHTLGPCCPDAEGAWHGAEIGQIFGTVESRGQGKNTAAEERLAKSMREAWTAFAKDPENGLSKLVWPVYDSSKSTVVVIGGKNSADIKFESPKTLDPSCSLVGM